MHTNTLKVTPSFAHSVQEAIPLENKEEEDFDIDTLEVPETLGLERQSPLQSHRP